MPRGFFSCGARLVQRDKLLPFLIDNQAACRRDMGKERCHSLTTREALAGFRTLPDKGLVLLQNSVLNQRSQKGRSIETAGKPGGRALAATRPFPKSVPDWLSPKQSNDDGGMGKRLRRESAEFWRGVLIVALARDRHVTTFVATARANFMAPH